MSDIFKEKKQNSTRWLKSTVQIEKRVQNVGGLFFFEDTENNIYNPLRAPMTCSIAQIYLLLCMFVREMIDKTAFVTIFIILRWSITVNFFF